MHQLLLIFGLLTGLAADGPPQCESFEACLRKTLSSSMPLERAYHATRGIGYFAKGHPQRDLFNLLSIRAESLVQMHLKVPNETLLSQAEADYHQMLEMRPGDYLPQTGLARIAELRGQSVEAENLYASAVGSGDFLAYLDRAEYRLRQQQADLALSDLDEAMRLVAELQARERDIHPQHLIRMHRLRARSLESQGRVREAVAAIKAACGAGEKPACIEARRRERWGPF